MQLFHCEYGFIYTDFVLFGFLSFDLKIQIAKMLENQSITSIQPFVQRTPLDKVRKHHTDIK